MSIRLENAFEVPLNREAAWDLLLDVESMAGCMPGATLDEVIDDRTFRGTVHVKLGPVALAFGGRAQILSADRATWTIAVRGAGDEKRGRGRAQADFAFVLAETAAGMTRVQATTDVTMTGAVAQYGRAAGVMKAVATEIVGQFARNLAVKVGTGADAAGTGSAKRQDAPGGAMPPVGDRPPANAISAFGLAYALVRNLIARLLGRTEKGPISR
jgi:carbon monoxide dehydrogenase subunit G